jgi:hypothetical protein
MKLPECEIDSECNEKYKPFQKKDFGTESRHIRVETRRHTGVCRGFSRRINAESGTKDFFEMAWSLSWFGHRECLIYTIHPV